jgi:hypothetical protein
MAELRSSGKPTSSFWATIVPAALRRSQERVHVGRGLRQVIAGFVIRTAGIFERVEVAGDEVDRIAVEVAREGAADAAAPGFAEAEGSCPDRGGRKSRW